MVLNAMNTYMNIYDVAFPSFVPGKFVQRKNRFVAVVEMNNGRRSEAHVPNSGRLGELLVPGYDVMVASARPGRKTAYDLALVNLEGFWVSIDSRLPNQLFAAGLRRSFWPMIPGNGTWRPEVSWEDSRLDGIWESEGGRTWVEVKSVTLVENGVAMFPDAPTQRGRRHLYHLRDLVERGERALVAFIIQRPDAELFSPNPRTDPAFAAALSRAAEAGVTIVACTCRLDLEGIVLDKMIPVELPAAFG